MNNLTKEEINGAAAGLKKRLLHSTHNLIASINALDPDLEIDNLLSELGELDNEVLYFKNNARYHLEKASTYLKLGEEK